MRTNMRDVNLIKRVRKNKQVIINFNLIIINF